MPATIPTIEKFPAGTSDGTMVTAKKLRIKAGAITCEYKGSKAEGWTMTTTWNVIGE